MIPKENVHKSRLSYALVICLLFILLAVQVYTILRIRDLQPPPAQNTGVVVLTPSDGSPTTQDQVDGMHVTRQKIATFETGKRSSEPFELSWEIKVPLGAQEGQDTLPSELELGWIKFRLKGLQRFVDTTEQETVSAAIRVIEKLLQDKAEAKGNEGDRPDRSD